MLPWVLPLAPLLEVLRQVFIYQRLQLALILGPPWAWAARLRVVARLAQFLLLIRVLAVLLVRWAPRARPLLVAAPLLASLLLGIGAAILVVLHQLPLLSAYVLAARWPRRASFFWSVP